MSQEFECSLNANVNTENTKFDENDQSIFLTSPMVNMKPNNIFALARAFLCISSMTHKKLQKLCYYAKAWYLALYDSNLVDEHFEAWVHGAVQPDLYQRYRVYGYSDIPKETDKSNIPEEFLSFSQEVFNAYGHLSGDDLERINHSESPWKDARGNRQPWEHCNRVISEDSMRSFYRERLR